MRFRGVTSGTFALALSLAAPALAQTGNGVGTQFELAFWQSVTGSDDPTMYEAYLQQYPAGTFSALARAKVAVLRRSAQLPGPAPASPAPVAAQPAISAPLPTQVAVAAGVPVAEPPVVVTRAQSLPVPTPVSTPVSAAATAVAAPPVSSAKIVRVAEDAARTASPVPPVADDTALLEELAKSQEVGGATLKVAAAQGFALPPRPIMNALPDLQLPAAFCSAEQRNDFHETRYKPVMEIAQANNAAAVSHMQRLQQVYDSLQLARDPTPMNAVAHEAKDYQQVAADAYNRQLAMVQQFQAIMAVPVTSCQIAAAK
jgi:hypothetical protein